MQIRIDNYFNDSDFDNMKCKYKAIDLFAGIGGIRLGFEQAFGEEIEFVFANEINTFACETYEANFGENPQGDITQINPTKIPDFDILLAGFPCQAFSIAGEKRGFDDTRGTLFFNIAEVSLILSSSYNQVRTGWLEGPGCRVMRVDELIKF